MSIHPPVEETKRYNNKILLAAMIQCTHWIYFNRTMNELLDLVETLTEKMDELIEATVPGP